MNFLKYIKNETLLTFGDQYVLFELPVMSKPHQVEDAVFEMTLKGYKPILAHPERYPFYQEPGLVSLEKLKSMGYYFSSMPFHWSGFIRQKFRNLHIN